MTKKELARQLTKEAKELNLSIQKSSMRLGGIYKRVRDGKLYLEIPGCEHFAEWVQMVGGLHASQAHALATTYEKLEDTVPKRDLERMAQNNAEDLSKVPDRVKPKLVEAACTLTNAEFRKRVDAMAPGLHLPERGHISFAIDAQVEPLIKSVIQAVMVQQELKSQGAALEYLCSQWRLEHQELVQEIEAASHATVN